MLKIVIVSNKSAERQTASAEYSDSSHIHVSSSSSIVKVRWNAAPFSFATSEFFFRENSSGSYF